MDDLELPFSNIETIETESNLTRKEKKQQRRKQKYIDPNSYFIREEEPLVQTHLLIAIVNLCYFFENENNFCYYFQDLYFLIFHFQIYFSGF
jgi:hypothetical protein